MKKSILLTVLSALSITAFADSTSTYLADSAAISNAVKEAAEMAAKQAIEQAPATATPFLTMLLPLFILLVGIGTGWAIRHFKPKK